MFHARVGAVLCQLPWGRVGFADVVEQDEVEQKRLLQRGAFRRDDAAVAAPPQPDGVPLSALGPGIPDEPRLDARRVERMSVHEPTARLRE